MNRQSAVSELTKQKSYDVMKIRDDFPILKTKVHDKPLVYLDNAATTQKPDFVIDRINNYYSTMNSNIHRGVHALSGVSTEAFETARIIVKRFINALGKNEIIFTRGTTESVNLVAQTFGKTNINEGDEIIISHMEHHSNIVPWQMLCKEKNAKLRVIPIDDNGEIIYENYDNIRLSENYIKQLHQNLLRHSDKDTRHRGQYKSLSNKVVANYPGGIQKVIFNTTEVHLVDNEMNDLISWTNSQFENKEIHPLIIVANLIYEFLSIHPFQDGNGRLSRLLSTLLLLKGGSNWTQYVSFEQEIESRKN